MQNRRLKMNKSFLVLNKSYGCTCILVDVNIFMYISKNKLNHPLRWTDAIFLVFASLSVITLVRVGEPLPRRALGVLIRFVLPPICFILIFSLHWPRTEAEPGWGLVGVKNRKGNNKEYPYTFFTIQ